VVGKYTWHGDEFKIGKNAVVFVREECGKQSILGRIMGVGHEELHIKRGYQERLNRHTSGD